MNEICIRKIIKIHSSPQTAILARINTGIAEMLFRRTLTPKGIETVEDALIKILVGFRRTLTPKGIETVWSKPHKMFYLKFRRTLTPKGIETQVLQDPHLS